MNNRTNGREAAIPRPFKNYNSIRRPNLIIAVNPVKSCGHHRATVRNVIEPDGAAAYVCRDCFAHLRVVEVRAIAVACARRALARIFRNCWPPGFNPEAMAGRLVDYLLARALLAAFHDRSYRIWISLARLAARIAEGRAA